MNFFFQPTGQAYSREQIQGLVGIDPEVTDDEVLNFYGIFRVSSFEEKQDVFDSPLDFSYEVRGKFAYRVSAGIQISLSEAREKAKKAAIYKSGQMLFSLRQNSGLTEELFSVAITNDSDYFSELRSRANEITENLGKVLHLIETSEDDCFLREICGDG